MFKAIKNLNSSFSFPADISISDSGSFPADISYSDGKPTETTQTIKAEEDKAPVIKVEEAAEYDNSNSFYILIIFVLILLFGLGFYFATKKKS
jgi:hypothetical protein